jgi:predicted permease
VIAILSSVTINYFASDVWLPLFGRTALTWLGACSIPSQIILTGAVLADVIRRADPSSWWRPVVFGSIVRLGLMPIAILGLLARLGTSMELHHVIVVQAAMPSAMIPVVLVKHYDGDTDMAAWLVTITTVLGLITIPLWLQVGLWWIGK